MTFRIGSFLLAALCSFAFIYLVLALAEAGGPAACRWAFPRWFGCVLYVHESLAAGLVAAAGALLAAWIVCFSNHLLTVRGIEAIRSHLLAPQTA